MKKYIIIYTNNKNQTFIFEKYDSEVIAQIDLNNLKQSKSIKEVYIYEQK